MAIIDRKSNNEKRNKRIAKNTTLMFLRMLLLTIINLYTVRFVLKGLGVIDYGIFNAVAGVVTSASFISAVLALSIQRFFSIALGQEDEERLKTIFSASLNIIIILSITIIILFETVGLWFVSTQMTIPAERMTTAISLYQCSIFVFFFSLLQIPFTAIIFSHEDMGVYAIISTVDSLLRLALAVIITKISIDHLVFYSIGLLVESGVVSLLYIWKGGKYEECHYTKTKDKTLYQHLLQFSGWTMFGSLANMGMNQGNTILINLFFGPISNMAFAIAMQISNAFNALSNSMVLSFRPAMIRSYAESNHYYVNELFYISNKFIFYLLICIAIPIIAEMDCILKIWLGTANEETILFSRLIIIYIVISAISNPITIIMQASGHVKEYHFPVESITLCTLPLTWILFKLHFPSYTVFIAMISTCVIAHIVRLICLRHYYQPFDYIYYVRDFLLPAIGITTLAIGCTFFFKKNIINLSICFILIFLITPSLVLLTAYNIGISKNEKVLLKRFITSFLSKKHV
ncbi:polysaccharide biosynthesis protein [Prevotella denticola]|uniref:polysaccharide biosynthesis protein n=1 Tax=Prevotella denticola TaxID=28129 RepID=UPI001BAD42AE|nr:polysaccharide biosynthesis protein [Prevotella denticola]MBW4897543.1 polysaccharide biosynthesis protein [Prevotella denticola]QUB93653.1 polysaccharide biosynthesis protein [Prevotella denticola]